MVASHSLTPPSGGAGGHYTWGTPMSDLECAPAVLDKNDPNYDPDDPQGERQLEKGCVAWLGLAWLVAIMHFCDAF